MGTDYDAFCLFCSLTNPSFSPLFSKFFCSVTLRQSSRTDKALQMPAPRPMRRDLPTAHDVAEQTLTHAKASRGLLPQGVQRRVEMIRARRRERRARRRRRRRARRRRSLLYCCEREQTIACRSLLCFFGGLPMFILVVRGQGGNSIIDERLRL